ncbi:unnamed protein product [Gulo gulo]|uniref:Uncharacterized protein n=1 Tax=Gulo gulo TaxID=48420 RepID=A0A9X9LQE9_GULGU|nr:unnamed protein product [Gulo gulo]
MFGRVISSVVISVCSQPVTAAQMCFISTLRFPSCHFLTTFATSDGMLQFV